jgi:integrase
MIARAARTVESDDRRSGEGADLAATVGGPETPEHRRAVAVPGHPGIFRKGSRYQVRYRHHGRQKARSFRTVSEATRFKRQVDAGDSQPTSRQPFKSYALRWVEEFTGRTARGVSDTTRDSYRDALTRFAIPFFGTMPLDRIDPPMLREYIGHLAATATRQRTTNRTQSDSKETTRSLAPSSVRRFYAPLRALLATAYEDGLLRTNPAAGVRVIVPDKWRSKARWLTTEQTKAILAAIPAEHSDLAYFLAATGCRISEVLATRWEDIGPDENGKVCLTVRESKTPAGRRTITLSPETARRLTKRRTEARYRADADPLFPTSGGTPIDDHNWRRRVFNPAAEDAGVPWATPHKLRHGVATLMADQRYSAAQIAAQLGHADGGVLALKTYIHADRLDSADFLDDAFCVDPGVDPAASEGANP